MFDLQHIRKEFPILQRQVNGNPLVYFDNGATTQKPLKVIDAISEFYRQHNANIHRGVHTLSREATQAYESARKNIANYFGLSNEQQIIFTAGTTDSINLVAQGLAKKHLKPGDEIILTVYEHHSNILPWQLWAQENGGHLKIIPLKSNQELDLEYLASQIGPKTKLIALAQVSNTLGNVSDVKAICARAKKAGIPVLIDGAQSAPHMKVDLFDLGADFFVCSAHKMYGPTGIGLLCLSEKWMKDLPQTRTGGGTIKTVSFEKTEYAEGALRFEAGTPDIAGAIGFSEAIHFIRACGIENIQRHEEQLLNHALSGLKQIPEIELYGSSEHKAGVISFNVKGQHPFDVGTLLDKYGIAVRTGHHCTQPLMQSLGIQGTVRMSFAVYNTLEEVDYFMEKLRRCIQLLN
ncbi:MAG TPA: cysteine desulfurase [Bacteroidia bacterium]|nr:cysteine desulfurase [Bacteroidia bacterium]